MKDPVLKVFHRAWTRAVFAFVEGIDVGEEEEGGVQARVERRCSRRRVSGVEMCGRNLRAREWKTGDGRNAGDTISLALATETKRG